MTGKTGESLLSAQLGGVSVLKRVLERCARMPGIGALICVMSNDPAMDSAAADAEQCDALVIRGD
ncbi:MAG: hypothetical protein ABUS57_22060, partial [Pseudomonadota bacterium]